MARGFLGEELFKLRPGRGGGSGSCSLVNRRPQRLETKCPVQVEGWEDSGLRTKRKQSGLWGPERRPRRPQASALSHCLLDSQAVT